MNSKVKNGISTAANVVTDGAINVASVGAGGLFAVYCINHDAMNDQDLSAMTGIVGGAVIGGVTHAALKGVKRTIVGGAKAVKCRLSQKSKKNAAQP